MVLVGGGMALAGWFNGRVPGLRALCTETRTEEPYFSWYTEGGSFDQPFSLHPSTDVEYTVPKEDFSGFLVVVMRDRRGGMAWQVLRVTNETE